MWINKNLFLLCINYFSTTLIQIEQCKGGRIYFSSQFQRFEFIALLILGLW